MLSHGCLGGASLGVFYLKQHTSTSPTCHWPHLDILGPICILWPPLIPLGPHCMSCSPAHPFQPSFTHPVSHPHTHIPWPPLMCLMQSGDCVCIAFMWVAHTQRGGMGDCKYAVAIDTLYEHDIKNSELSEAQVEGQILVT